MNSLKIMWSLYILERLEQQKWNELRNEEPINFGKYLLPFCSVTYFAVGLESAEKTAKLLAVSPPANQKWLPRCPPSPAAPVQATSGSLPVQDRTELPQPSWDRPVGLGPSQPFPQVFASVASGRPATILRTGDKTLFLCWFWGSEGSSKTKLWTVVNMVWIFTLYEIGVI